MHQEYERASCLALCSFQENAPVVISEAMAAGVPVVASEVGGIPSMVEDGATGRLVDPRDHLRIARALADVLEPDRGERMSRRAREVAGERFRASAVAQKTFNVYREILEGKAQRGGLGA
jgi:glycosyltransferase involved in cell wall biosynthesis